MGGGCDAGGAWKVRVKTGGARGLREVTVIYVLQPSLGKDLAGGEGAKDGERGGERGGGSEGRRERD